MDSPDSSAISLRSHFLNIHKRRSEASIKTMDTSILTDNLMQEASQYLKESGVITEITEILPEDDENGENGDYYKSENNPKTRQSHKSDRILHLQKSFESSENQSQNAILIPPLDFTDIPNQSQHEFQHNFQQNSEHSTDFTQNNKQRTKEIIHSSLGLLTLPDILQVANETFEMNLKNPSVSQLPESRQSLDFGEKIIIPKSEIDCDNRNKLKAVNLSQCLPVNTTDDHLDHLVQNLLGNTDFDAKLTEIEESSRASSKFC